MKLLLLTLIAAISVCSNAQNDTLVFNKVGEFQYSGFYSVYSPVFDKLDRAYLYTASNELGLVTFDISDISDPVPVDTILPAQLHGLKLTNISQNGNYVFGSLGNIQGFTQDAGLVIFDVSDPVHPVVTDIWDTAYFHQGSAIALNVGNYAYLGVMDSGMVILDVSDKYDIQFLSHIRPYPDFPQIPGPLSVPNGRGMEMRNDTLLLCYDAGGLRMIDVTDKYNPQEIHMYVNTTLDAQAAAAYNNVVMSADQKYAYIAVDYCGIDVVDVSGGSTNNVNWINPWNCNNTNWQGSDGHTNQLKIIGDSLIFVCAGNTELVVYDVSDKASPALFASWFSLTDSMACWGLDVKNNLVALGMINNPSGLGFVANWGGIQILEFDAGNVAVQKYQTADLSIFPNPSSDYFQIESTLPVQDVTITNLSGQIVENPWIDEYKIDVSNLTRGIYFVHVQIADRIIIRKIVLN